jgi:hypothetical protein
MQQRITKRHIQPGFPIHGEPIGAGLMKTLLNSIHEIVTAVLILGIQG